MVVEIENLVKEFKERKAVNNVNISIKEGEIFGFLGPNGAGKTTTINALVGLTSPNSGSIRILGDSTAKHRKKVNKNIGLVPQDIAIFEDLKAKENVEFFGRLYGLRGTELKERVQAALEFTGLWDRRKEYPKKFSGGMKRRLNIACAIVHQPKLIIMDEPTVGVDPQSRNHILRSIVELNKRGSTIIYTSHYMEEVEEVCGNIAIMDNGEVIAQGTSDELKKLISSEKRMDITLKKVTQYLIDELNQIDGIKSCTVENQIMTILYEQKNDLFLSLVIETITKYNAEIIAIDVENPSLEDVFLTLTGKKLRD
ncbi:ABC transporter ATP-binding protein [Viridibacillus sp. YIM B01967]|uniref:ABC transporter ATP-binding protein n=1 Tax=Viridibacillus soli TaxID=2798301 RepID=A0ABS1H5P2_9BACL|nr:ABC transporter ATP-binding protein [Viridibacillus soli]MBK3494737.1 ABC transporter ATP-binding protein [Viridibacillus soli]